jgi:anti-anti-sigma factor
MEIKQEFREGVLVVHVQGQIDSTTAPPLHDRLDDNIDAGYTYLVLDLSDVPYVSSAGLRVLSLALKRVRQSETGGELCLAGLSDTVEYAFRISGFNQLFYIYESVSEAVTAMAVSQEADPWSGH